MEMVPTQVPVLTARADLVAILVVLHDVLVRGAGGPQPQPSNVKRRQGGNAGDVCPVCGARRPPLTGNSWAPRFTSRA